MNATTTRSSAETTAPKGRPFYTRLAALGFGLIAFAGVFNAVFGLIQGSTNTLDFTLPIVIIGLLIAGALLRFGVWAQVLAGLLSLALLALLLPFSVFNLLHPESAGEFVPIVLFIAGSAFGLVGAVVGLIQRRRHSLRVAPTVSESSAVKVILAVVAVAALVSLGLTATARTALSAEIKSSAVSVDIKSFSFSPNFLAVKAGDTVRLAVKNDDPTLHTFTLPEAGIDVAIPPGSEKLVEFKAPAAGQYRWYCIPHSDAGPNGRTGMIGELAVH